LALHWHYIRPHHSRRLARSKVFKRARITSTAVEKLAAGDTIMDVGLAGYGVRRQGEARIFFIRKHANGRRHYVTIGEHGREGWTEARARAKALVILAAIKQGADPNSDRAKARTMPTLAEFAERFIAQAAARLKPGTIANYRGLLATYIAPRNADGAVRAGCVGRVRLDKVSAQDLTALHLSLRERPRAANHVLAFVSTLYTAAQVAGLVAEGFNPARRIEHYRLQPRQRFLSEMELARVGDALDAAERDGSEDPFALAALRLLILTGCRRDEILGARWSWVDLDRGLLNLPDSKTGAKAIHLSPAAIEILERIPRITGNPYVIVGAKEGQRWVGLRRVWVRVRERANLQPAELPNGRLQPVRLHDLRHSFASLLASSGASLPMIGKLLGHAHPSTTARYAHLAEDPLRRLTAEVGDLIQLTMRREAQFTPGLPSKRTRGSL
jgi:integrase